MNCQEIKEFESTKLIGVVMDNDQKCKSDYCDRGDLLSSLNQRLFIVKRLSKDYVESLSTSKQRYGL